MLSTSSFATSPSSLSSSSSSAAVSRFVPNPRGLLCHRQERTMSINIYNKHAQTKREREKPIGKRPFPEKSKQNANTRTNALTSSEDAIPSSSKVSPPTSSSSFCVDVIIRPRREGERDRDRGERNTHHPYSKTIALFLSDFVQILSSIEHLLKQRLMISRKSYSNSIEFNDTKRIVLSSISPTIYAFTRDSLLCFFRGGFVFDSTRFNVTKILLFF